MRQITKYLLKSLWNKRPEDGVLVVPIGCLKD